MASLGRVWTFLANKLSDPGAMEMAPADEETGWASRHQIVVERFRPYLEGRTVIDYGCWNGSVLRCAVALGLSVSYHGYDVHPGIIRLARQTMGQLGSFAMLTEEGMFPPDTPSADTILFLDVIEHVGRTSEPAYLAELVSQLRPGGTLIVSCPALNIWSVLDPAWFLGHRHYTANRLTGLLTEAGLQIGQVLRTGTIMGELDTLAFYVHKHLMRRRYERPAAISRLLERELQPRRLGTHLFVAATKPPAVDSASAPAHENQ